jgi:ABC-type bacteriocin/lantibiotic exporter with double-glycine peptidase domain
MTSNLETSGLLSSSALRKLGPAPHGKVPVILQLTPTDCGAACLAMALAYHGKRLPIEEVRNAVASGRGGVSGRRILEAARALGLRARGAKLEPDKLAYLPPGTILHWEMNHFVVLEMVQRDGIRVIDPAVGPRRIAVADVARMFTGVALLLDPSPEFVAEDRRPKTRRGRYRRWIFGVRGYWPRVLVASLLLQLIALAMPGVMGVTVDKIVPRQDYHLLGLVAAGLLMVASFHFIAGFLRSHLLLHLRTYIDLNMTLEFLEHLLDLPYAFFQQRSAGDILMRLGSGAQIRELLTSGAMAAMLDGVMVILYFGLLVAIAPSIAAIALGIALAQILVYWRAGRMHAELMAEQLATQAKLSGFQVEMLAGMESVKSMGAEQRMGTRWTDLYVDVLNTSLAKSRLMTNFGALVGSLGFAGPVAIVLVGAKLVLDGDLSLGSMLALSALASGFLGPVGTLVSTAMQLQLLSGYMTRIEDVLDTKTERKRAAQGRGKPLEGRIELARVAFRYEAQGPLVLDDISLRIEPGEFVAIVGASGSGKSTLARLLAALYRPLSGQLSFDSIDAAHWDPPELRRQLGMVTQDTRLFAASVRDNIAMLDPEVPLERVETVARIAQIHDDIMTLPMGYDSVLSDGGASLSGGQRQRLALARALLHEPAVVVLDEATSALDTLTEKRIQEQLGRLRCTRVVIAHRLSTVVDADRIVVLERGRLVGIGRHLELLASCETYRLLVEAQARGVSGA